MVASLVLNRPTRVFARLTHTGENKTADPLCCDLSRVAAIMPANPLPKNLVFPHAADHSPPPSPSPVSSKFQSLAYQLCGGDKTMSRKRKRDEDCEEKNQASTARTQNSSVVGEGIKASPSKIVKLDAKSATNGNNTVRIQNKELTITEASKLLAENEKLKVENETLKDKLVFLHMILQNEENKNLLIQTIKENQRVRPMPEGSK